MRLLPTFSLRDLCLSIAFIAFVLAGLGWLSTAFSINPASERILVLGESVELPWEETKWGPGHSGVSGDLVQIRSDRHLDGPRAFHHPVDRFKRQRLILIAYDDYFGGECFNARVNVNGYFASRDKAYSIYPVRSGGGSIDGGFACSVDFDAESMMLTLRVRQWLNRKRIAKKATLRFVFEDGHFRYLEP